MVKVQASIYVNHPRRQPASSMACLLNTEHFHCRNGEQKWKVQVVLTHDSCYVADLCLICTQGRPHPRMAAGKVFVRELVCSFA